MATVLYDELDFCDIVTNEKESLILHFKENPEEMIGLLGSNLSISDIAMGNACDFMSDCLNDAEETLHKIFDGKASIFSYRSNGWNYSRNGFCVNDFFTIYEGLKNAKGNPACIEINDNAVYIEFPDHDGGEFITVKVINTNDDYYKGVLSSGLSVEKVKKHIYNYCTCAIPEGIAD
ncbi:hypothetical protein [Allisonella histaminiformans]|uniref:hypothetical protein n=1 Tax=Allisonella histaminiformans TaxID=209880 RepID=UPI002E792D1D|nr:hypothetical protein [Allisonella histaminiformans]